MPTMGIKRWPMATPATTVTEQPRWQRLAACSLHRLLMSLFPSDMPSLLYSDRCILLRLRICPGIEGGLSSTAIERPVIVADIIDLSRSAVGVKDKFAALWVGNWVQRDCCKCWS